MEDSWEEEGPRKKWYKKWWGILISAVGGLILLTALLFAWQVSYYYRQIKGGQMPIIASEKFTSSHFAATPQKIDLSRVNPPGEPNSKTGAPLTAVVFLDFQCPFSVETYPAIRELQTEYDDKINFVIRNFPLTEIHSQAMLAAQAAECAHLQNKFWLMADKIFSAQDLSDTSLKLYAQQIGLDENQFTECLNTYTGRGQVLKDILDGQTLGVTGTPTWFIEGEKIKGAIPPDIFRKILNYFLNQKGQSSS